MNDDDNNNNTHSDTETDSDEGPDPETFFPDVTDVLLLGKTLNMGHPSKALLAANFFFPSFSRTSSVG
jgi:hypothetical protein